MPAKQNRMPGQNGADGEDSDGSLTWEDFFGTTTAEDLVPTLLGMYDALVGGPRTRPPLAPTAPRPLSVVSIASSSSSSSSSVQSGGGGGVGRGGLLGGGPQTSVAYLASIESLDDSEPERRPRNPPCHPHRTKSSNGSQVSGDSGVCSPCSYISSPSPPYPRPRYFDPHLSYMDRVLMEILETEGVYVSDLQQVIVGYLERWESSPDCAVSKSQLADLFNNIREIFHFNRAFLSQLEQCGLNPVRVAKCFVNNNSGFAIYTDYCTNYPRTVSVLTELMRQESTVRLFRERQAALQHTLPLGSYLLKPVQRILKYHLLLQNIVKQYSPEAAGYGDILDALSTMTAIAHHINDMKRKHEHAVRVQEIQSLLLDWRGEDLTTFGELCAEGTFRMAGAKALRHAFLFDQMLLITKKKEAGILGYKAHITCSNLMLIESVPGEPLSFHVIPFDNPRLQYTLQARSLEQKREWTLQLKRVILENYNAVIPSHARQLVMQLGQNRTDDEILAEKGTPKRQHSAPEYLERQRERRKSEAGLRARLRVRTRKSEPGVVPSKVGQQKLRRSRQNSENEELVSPETTVDRCGTIRRKSEPNCFINRCNMTPVELHISETDLRTEKPQAAKKKRTIEEMISQLLNQNREFQRVLRKQRMWKRRGPVAETSDEEDDPAIIRSSFRSHKFNRSLRSCWSDQENLGQRTEYENLEHVWQGVRLLKENKSSLKRSQSFSSQNSSPDESVVGCSMLRLSPTSPAVWLRQQHEHLAVASPTSHKSGSLPRSFPLAHAPRPVTSPERPVTIASDKAHDLTLDHINRYMEQDKDGWRHRYPADYTTEDDSTTDYTVSMQNLHVHPEYKIYRPGVTKAALKHVISSVSSKLASLRVSSEMLDETELEKRSRLMQVLAKLKSRKEEGSDSPIYKQGSSRLGARIAQGSDYADPRVLFPSITPSKKAASLLGIRPYSVLSLVSNLTSSSDGDKTSGYGGSVASNSTRQTSSSVVSSPKKEDTIESDGSADSFYERSFEAMESTMDGDLYRDSAVFSDPDDGFEPQMKVATKIAKVPPPVPAKPTNLKPIWNLPKSPTCDSIVKPSTNNIAVKSEADEGDSSSVASTVIENTCASKGWVKHVIGKLQGDITPT
ncbi:pleckstrin homology domain-containing family G member 1 isoform X1 [Nilaparvata lugens]|uniref:pleckstrin homology domain-containing family G member 1 isoform X1 n=2 Tax=Nilaparvata lugens TaxID=108931 RepID=UPI00193DA959|nr:pleckstrin homology domain-containing family G member 1 isoform X1 [Nilaparvata lugens]